MSSQLNFAARAALTRTRIFTLGLAVAALGPACGAAADVFEQAPSEKAMVVIRINDLDKLSHKIAKEAKDLALDQKVPELADPLGAMEDKAHISKGVNKDGDAGVIFLDPSVGGSSDKSMILLVPTSDYAAFVSNFKDPKVDGDITTAMPQDPDDTDPVFIAHWGDYAAVAPSAEDLKLKHEGIKLTGVNAEWSKSRDVFGYVNMEVARPLMLKQMESFQGMIDALVNKNANASQKMIMELYLAGCKKLMADATSASFALNLSDKGYKLSTNADFKPESKFGALLAKQMNSATPLLNGLPQVPYWIYGGAAVSPDVVNEALDMVKHSLQAENSDDPTIKQAIESMDQAKAVIAASKSDAFGLLAVNGRMGQDSLVQALMVVQGDAPTIAKAQRKSVSALGKPVTQDGLTRSVTLTPEGKTVGDIKLDAIKFTVEADDSPAAVQAKHALDQVFGPAGMEGALGAVNDQTFISSLCLSDDVLAKAVAAAQKNDQTLATSAGVKEVDAMLPKKRFAVTYIAVDNLASSAKNYAGMFMPNFQLPANLPPIGFAAATQDSSLQIEMAVPESLVQSLVAAGMQAQQQQGGGGL